MLRERKMKMLEDEKLEEVAGGVKKIQYVRVACIKCKAVFEADMSKTKVKCPACNTVNSFAG